MYCKLELSTTSYELISDISRQSKLSISQIVKNIEQGKIVLADDIFSLREAIFDEGLFNLDISRPRQLAYVVVWLLQDKSDRFFQLNNGTNKDKYIAIL